MDNPEHIAVRRLGLASEDPCEHDGSRGAVAALVLALPARLLEELADLLVHDVQVVVGVILPQIKIGKLNWDVERVVISEALNDIAIWLLELIAADRAHKLRCVQ